ncbi:DNA repair protein RecO [Candidatus Uhrbacteria bacterium]|nr:DNA repair protein RecO [Candidatus Uhrbacteria bacterium]
MSLLYQTTGIVLSRRDYREADRWYSVFTPDKGKVEFLARGGSKPLAKLTPHLEMIAEVELLLVFGRHYQTVAGVDRKRSFAGIYDDISKLTLAHNAMHLLDIGTRPQESDPNLYHLLSTWLAFLEKSPSLSKERAAFLTASFTLKLLALIGYHPELTSCLACRKPVSSGAFKWHALKGGVVCKTCALSNEQQWFAARAMTDSTLKLVRHALYESFENQLRPHLKGEDIAGFHEAVESLIISHFPTIPASSLRASCGVC